MTALTRRPIESTRLTVADVRYEQAIVALLAFGTALAVVASAYLAGFVVGRFAL